VLALLLFGPKKLPELGRTIGKAVTEFRRASNELKATWNREMSSIERENQSLKEITSEYNPDTYQYGYDFNYDSSYSYAEQTSASNDSTADTSTVGASATQGADSEHGTAPEGTVATTVAVPGTEEPQPAEPGAEPRASQPANGAQSAES
jgi:TatA/E family protein of Tat protein translocase